ncbi:unnamed protein product [Arctia plantaginis]|uniref:Uncharacterized protein n=1 Tax=Arctia plantaginis TaxID=874455 RepID=A0A8S1AND7_ARCPL|nr:unnamed protein product [Arctia plantaginis]
MHTSTETQATVMTPISKQRNLTSKRRKVKSPRVFTTRTVPDSQEKTADRSPTGDVMTGNAPVPSSVASCTFNSDPPPPSPPLPAASPYVSNDSKKTFSAIVQNGRPKKQSSTVQEEWTLVQKKRRLRNRFVGSTGKAILDLNSNFKAADIKVPIYVYNVSKETTESDIKAYLLQKTNLDIKIDKINMKLSKDYNGYIAFVPKQKLELFLKDDFWPEGILYRRYFDFKRKQGTPAYREINGANLSIDG